MRFTQEPSNPSYFHNGSDAKLVWDYTDSQNSYQVHKASNEFTVKFGIVSRVDVLDDQGSSSFNFNSSFVRMWNIRMFLDTTTAINLFSPFRRVALHAK